jgi:hypothetical protein
MNMAKLLEVLCAAILGGTLAIAQSNGNAGGGQTSSPGNGQPGTGNVAGTGSEITTAPQTTGKTATGKTKKGKSHKSGTKGKKSANPANSGTNSSTPK